MKLLLDSHVLLWWSMASPKLGRRARDLILDNDAQLFMSAASWWELGIKCALKKLQVDLPTLRHSLEQRGVVTVPVTMEHAEMAASLPVIHRDPFDHMLVAQATFEDFALLTRDKKLKAYGPSVLCV